MGAGGSIDGRADTVTDSRPPPTPVEHAGARAPFAPGAVLAERYRVVRHIATGGMGEVYEVEDLALRERVALKTVRDDRIGAPAAEVRFRREIQLARKITHPNVCRIFDLGFHRVGASDVPFFTMELLTGESLAERLRRVGSLDSQRALPLISGMAAGLDAAHAAGVIHRDLKTQNVMLITGKVGERAIITDFGVARATEPSLADAEGGLTGGRIIGSPAYMAPEQLLGQTADERSDVYAFGVVLFEMLSGRLPFEGETPLAIAIRRVREPPASLASLVPELDRAWVAAIDRCLAVDPAARFGSAMEVVEALGVGEAARPARRRWRIRAIGGRVAAGAVASAVVVAAVLIPRSPPRRDPLRGTPYQRGVEHLRRWESAAARAALAEAVAAAPRDPLARLAHCRSLIAVGDLAFADANAAAEAARGLALPDVPADTARLLEACRRVATGDDAGATSLYREAFDQQPQIETGLLLVQAADTALHEATLAELRAMPEPVRSDPRLDVADGVLHFVVGDLPGARSRFAKAAAGAEAAGLPIVQAVALSKEASTLRSLGDLRGSGERLERAEALCVRAGERAYLAQVVAQHAQLLDELGEHRHSIAVREQSVELWRQAAGTDRQIWTLGELAVSRAVIGDREAARRAVAEMAQLGEAQGNSSVRVRADYARSRERLHAGDVAEARRLIEAARDVVIGHPGGRIMRARYDAHVGAIALAAGDLPAARRSLEQALETADGMSYRPGAECTRVLLAATRLAEGKPAEAAPLARAAVDALAAMGVRDCEVRGRVVWARALRALGKGAGVPPILAAAKELSSEDLAVRWELAVALAEDAIAHADRADAVARLTGVIDEARGFEIPDAAIAAMVALGELELQDVDTDTAGRARLEAAADRAHVVGQALVERRARAALAAP